MAKESIRASEESKALRLMEPVAKAADDLTELRGHAVGPLESHTDPYDRCSARLEHIQAMCSLAISGQECDAFKHLNANIQMSYIEAIHHFGECGERGFDARRKSRERRKMTPAEYIDDILTRRYANICLNADRQVAAAARAADRAGILERASREMELVRECQTVIAACGLRGAA
jgi:hypothetical protein